MESLQASLEAEQRGKTEALRAKKKLESDINELEAGLDGANRGRAEAEKNSKRLFPQLAELQLALEEERRGHNEAQEQLLAAERKFNACNTELEETTAQLEASEKVKKAIEGRLQEALDRVAEIGSSTGSLTAAKKKLENDVQMLQVRLLPTSCLKQFAHTFISSLTVPESTLFSIIFSLQF